MYRLGLRPWEIDREPDEFAALLEAWPGNGSRALDLGCGTGRETLLLAQHGWEVVGVDFVQRAIDRAQQRLDEAGAHARLLVGDVTRLGELDLGGQFDLVLDLKCFHGLSGDNRSRYVDGVAFASRPGGTYLLFALARSRLRALSAAPGGVNRRDVERLFEPSFEMLAVREGSGGPFTPTAFRMRRRA
jgi:SAM-dependent methyltransferase